MKAHDETLALRSGLTVATRRWGSGSRRCLALHGWIDNVGSFDALAPLLLEAVDDLTIVAVDLPGHGQSDWKASSAEYHYVDWVAVVADIIAALGWERTMLIGHSMGAGIAGLYAGVFPDRVERLVMLEGLGPYTTAARDAVDNLRRAIEARGVHFGREPREMASLDAAVERKRAALPYLDETAARALVERGTRPAGDGVAYSHDPRLTGRSLLRFTEQHVLAMLERVDCPTLVVRALEGLKYPEDGGDTGARMSALRDADVLEVEGHHHVHLTEPERLSGAVASFLSMR